MKIKDLYEAIVIGGNSNNHNPLKNNDTIRVYHGTSTPVALSAVKHGLTGEGKAPRKFSYETNNNPRGLFVTPSFGVARSFGLSILELHVRVSDLEAPVWPKGGLMGEHSDLWTAKFNSQQHRRQAASDQLAKYSQSELDYIRNSDDPALAFWLLDGGGEQQALFRGNLNRNSVRAVWVSKGGSYSRMSPMDFIKSEDSHSAMLDDTYEAGNFKLVQARDMVSGEDLVNKMMMKFKISRERAVSILKSDDKQILQLVWTPSQFSRVKRDLIRM